MKTSTLSLRILGPLAMIVTAGCAPAYHDYSGCYVDCHYCTPPPLAYPCYDECVCHACAASKYLTGQTPPVDPKADATVDKPTE